jgi:cell division protein FtsW
MSAAAIRHPGEMRWETRLIAVITVTLTVFGIASVYSATSLAVDGMRLAMNQLTGALAGGVALVVASRIDYMRLRPLAWPVLGAILVLLLIPLLPFTHGISPVENGARRWVKLGMVSFQPSEAARFAIVLWAAALAAKKGLQVREFKHGVLPFLEVFGLVALLVLRQPNLSMATMLALLGGVVLFTAGAKLGPFFLLVFAGGLIVLRKVLDTGYRSERLFAFLNPDASLGDAGYQVHQSLVGLGTGGLFGVGFGQGQQKLEHLPYSYSDFVFSAIGEEWGFLGTLLIATLYAVFCWLGFRIARTARDPFGQFMAAGLTAGIGITAFMHMAVNLSLIPTTGLPLPFLSHGRSNLMINLLSVGVILSIGRMRGRGVGRKKQRER